MLHVLAASWLLTTYSNDPSVKLFDRWKQIIDWYDPFGCWIVATIQNWIRRLEKTMCALKLFWPPEVWSR